MRAIQSFTVKLDIEDPVDYSVNPDATALSMVQGTYSMRCFAGVFIIRPFEIVRRSFCDIPTTNLKSQGSVDVTFRARVIVVSPGSIISGVTISSRAHIGYPVGISSVGAVCTAILTGVGVDAIAADQRIAVRVANVQCMPMVEQVTVIGTLLVCDRSPVPGYLLRGHLSAEAAAALQPYVDAIKEALAARVEAQATRADDLRFHEDLLYAFREAGGGDESVVETAGFPTWRGPPARPPPDGAERINLLELVAQALAGQKPRVDGVWSRGVGLHRSSPLVERVDRRTDMPPGWAEPVAFNPTDAFATFLASVVAMLEGLNNEIGVYNTPELLASHKNIWAARRRAQIE